MCTISTRPFLPHTRYWKWCMLGLVLDLGQRSNLAGIQLVSNWILSRRFGESFLQSCETKFVTESLHGFDTVDLYSFPCARKLTLITVVISNLACKQIATCTTNLQWPVSCVDILSSATSHRWHCCPVPSHTKWWLSSSWVNLISNHYIPAVAVPSWWNCGLTIAQAGSRIIY